MTIKQVLTLVAEMEEERTKTERIPVYYKRKGQMVRRSYDDWKYTERFTELRSIIREQKVFRCGCCGRKVDYFSLEAWTCNFAKHDYECSFCYEEEMGDDL